MKLKLKEEELTKAKEESDMYKNSTVQLAKQKFELESEGDGLRLEVKEAES
jgi:hypothetical protein